MRLTSARKKFLLLSVTAIILVQGGRAVLFADRQAKAALAAEEEGPRSVAAFRPLESEYASLSFESIADEIDLAESFGAEALEGPAVVARAGQCVPSASVNASPVWVSNTADPNYATFRYFFQLNCAQPAGATTGCEPFVYLAVTYKWVGGAWTNLHTYYSNPIALGCNVSVPDVIHSQPNTIDIVTGPGGGAGSYRSQMFVYKLSDFHAANWGAYVTYSYYDWTY